MDTYILKGTEPICEPDYSKWEEWFSTHNRVIKKTEVAPGVEVSTVFLGKDHSFGEEKPILFETIVFGGLRDEEQERYSTWNEAVAGHQMIVNSFAERCRYCGTLRESSSVNCSHCGGAY